MKKKLVWVALTFVVIYSCLWFITSKIVQDKAYKYFDELQQEKIISEHSGTIFISGFPFSFNINLAHPRILFQKKDLQYNVKCDMLFDGILSAELGFFSDMISLKPVGDLHLKGNINKYNFNSTIGGKNSYYKIRLTDSLIWSALKGSIGTRGKDVKDLVAAVIDKISIHNEELSVINKLTNKLLIYANEIDLKLDINGDENNFNLRYIENLSDAEFHKEFAILNSEIFSLPFIRKFINKIDVNIRNYFDVFSFDKLGKINHKIDAKIDMKKDSTVVNINKLMLSNSAYNVEANGTIDLSNKKKLNLDFKGKFSDKWYELMKVYASKLRLRELNDKMLDVSNSIISKIFNSIFGFIKNMFSSPADYALYVPKLQNMGMITGDIDVQYKETKDSFGLDVNKFKLKANNFAVNASGQAKNEGKGEEDQYNLKANLSNYPFIVESLSNYVNRVTKSIGQSFFIFGKKLTISHNTSKRIEFFLRDISDHPKSASENLNLTIVNNNGSKCPAVGRYSSTEFCVVWHGFVFNLLLGEIAKNLTPDEMARSLLNVPIKGPRSIQREAGKLAKDIMGGLFGGLLGLDKKK